ncbi:MAG TPA: hypothetical protein VKP69_28415 [Isosphaeraceae bacterium]|nr:hypothetical protein [Isosphaeraceae bacterium]
MRRERCGFVLAVGLAGLITSAALGQQEKEQRIDLAKVPATVKKAADMAAPGVTWHHASKEAKTIYELTGKNAHGREVEVEVTPEGEVIEIETAIPLSEVPKVALDAFKAKHPHLKATGAESVWEGGKIVAYDILTRKDHKSVEYRVSPDGKTVKFGEEEEEEEK